MASKNSGVDSASCGFANNPFLQKMGNKKIIARRRANTMPALSSSSKSVKTKAVIKPKIQPTAPKQPAPSTVKSKPVATTVTAPPSKPKSANKSTKRVSKVAALSASLSSKGISYGQTRPVTKPKPFKSPPECNTNTFDKPSIKKRRPKTKKVIDIHIDSDGDDENKDTSTVTATVTVTPSDTASNKDQIIRDLKLHITELKATQQQNEDELKLNNERIKTLKENRDRQAQEHGREVSRMEAEIAALQNTIAQLKDDDIVIVETDDMEKKKDETMDIDIETKSTENIQQTDSNYKVIKIQNINDVSIVAKEDKPITSKGLFDDVIGEQDGLFGDNPKQETEKMEHVKESKSVKVRNDPLMADTNALFEDILDQKEQGTEKKAKTVATARVRDIFDEDEQNDLFGFIPASNKRTEESGDKKKRIASLFDSDDDDEIDDLFGFSKGNKDDDTLNID
eukprot:769212_1